MMERVRRFLRDFTAMSVKEHLRSQLDTTGRSPDLTAREIELVRFIRERSADWEAHFANQPHSPDRPN
jgi:hypothetical protein